MADLAADARRAFGDRMRGLRLDAGLTGRGLAAKSGLHNTRISKIEYGRLNSTEADIRAWCTACGVPEKIPELIAEHREVQLMWVEHRQAMRGGMARVQAVDADYEQTRMLRAYESNRVPGILQTPGYVHGAMTSVGRLYDLPGGGDVEEAAMARLSRQRLITEGTGVNRYAFVIEASALDCPVGENLEVMHEQFDFLLRVSRLPHVLFGIIPPAIPRRIWAGECFYIFDRRMVRTGTWSGTLTRTRPDEINLYLKVFALLAEQAVYGGPARELVEAARERLPH